MINQILTQTEAIVVTDEAVTLGYDQKQTAPPRVLFCNITGESAVLLPITTPVISPYGQSIVPGVGDGYLLTIVNLSVDQLVIVAQGDDNSEFIPSPILQNQSITVCSSATNQTWYRVDQGQSGGNSPGIDLAAVPTTLPLSSGNEIIGSGTGFATLPSPTQDGLMLKVGNISGTSNLLNIVGSAGLVNTVFSLSGGAVSPSTFASPDDVDFSGDNNAAWVTLVSLGGVWIPVDSMGCSWD